MKTLLWKDILLEDFDLYLSHDNLSYPKLYLNAKFNICEIDKTKLEKIDLKKIRESLQRIIAESIQIKEDKNASSSLHFVEKPI